MLRQRLTLGGVKLKLDGTGIKVPSWRSGDKDGNTNPTSWFTSTLTGGFIAAKDFNRVGQKSSITNWGNGRATAYIDTPWKDVAVENIWAGNEEMSAMGCVKVSPEAENWEYTLSLYAEQWPIFNTTVKLPVVWYIGNPSEVEAYEVMDGTHSHTNGTPWKSRMEVVGRRVRAWEYSSGSEAYVGELILPKGMADSTKHGITHDVPLSYRPVWSSDAPNWSDPDWRDELTGFEDNPQYTDDLTGIGAQEDNFKVWPITHFSDESAGTLGPELLNDIDFDANNSDWVAENADWSVDHTTTDLHRPSAYVSVADSGSSFVSGYLRQTLSAPLVVGRRYRLTYGLYPANDPPRVYAVPFGTTADEIKGTVTCSVTGGGGTVTTTAQSGHAYTTEFVATYAHDTIEFLGQSEDDGGTHKLFQRVCYASLMEFTPD